MALTAAAVAASEVVAVAVAECAIAVERASVSKSRGESARKYEWL
jgi:hypothetical protein